MSHQNYHHRNPRGALTEPMRKVLDAMARAGHMPLHALSPAQARQSYEAGAEVLESARPQLARVQDIAVPARDGTALPARLYAPQAQEALPVLLYLHGGGFVVGSPDTHDALCRRLAHLAHCAVVSLHYRRAPEHRFPTAFEDSWDALQWLHTQAHTLGGLDGQRLAVGGDSAGGTLAAACAIAARDAGLPLALQLLFYPGVCAHQDTASHHTYGKGFLLEAEHMRYFFAHYLRSDADRSDWRFAPLDGHGPDGQAVDLQGVAPAWIGLAECDPLVDEGTAYADRLRFAGVGVELEIYRGVTHEFIKMGRALPQAQQALQAAAHALRTALGG
ncbi:MAG: alpha/beta hydrolase [Rhodoferax sp.]